MSSAVVTGVILSTMELGKATFLRTHAPSGGSRSSAKAENIFWATWPLPWMLSQDITVNGGIPRPRLRTSASVINPKTVAGTAPSTRSATIAGLSASNSPVTWSKL